MPEADEESLVSAIFRCLIAFVFKCKGDSPPYHPQFKSRHERHFCTLDNVEANRIQLEALLNLYSYPNSEDKKALLFCPLCLASKHFFSYVKFSLTLSFSFKSLFSLSSSAILFCISRSLSCTSNICWYCSILSASLKTLAIDFNSSKIPIVFSPLSF